MCPDARSLGRSKHVVFASENHVYLDNRDDTVEDAAAELPQLQREGRAHSAVRIDAFHGTQLGPRPEDEPALMLCGIPLQEPIASCRRLQAAKTVSPTPTPAASGTPASADTPLRRPASGRPRSLTRAACALPHCQAAKAAWPAPSEPRIGSRIVARRRDGSERPLSATVRNGAVTIPRERLVRVALRQSRSTRTVAAAPMNENSAEAIRDADALDDVEWPGLQIVTLCLAGESAACASTAASGSVPPMSSGAIGAAPPPPSPESHLPVRVAAAAAAAAAPAQSDPAPTVPRSPGRALAATVFPMHDNWSTVERTKRPHSAAPALRAERAVAAGQASALPLRVARADLVLQPGATALSGAAVPPPASVAGLHVSADGRRPDHARPDTVRTVVAPPAACCLTVQPVRAAIPAELLRYATQDVASVLSAAAESMRRRAVERIEAQLPGHGGLRSRGTAKWGQDVEPELRWWWRDA